MSEQVNGEGSAGGKSERGRGPGEDKSGVKRSRGLMSRKGKGRGPFPHATGRCRLPPSYTCLVLSPCWFPCSF